MRNFVCFAKKSVNAKPFSVQTIFFVHKNFVKRHQTSKRLSSSFGGLQFFVKRENLLFCDSYPSTGHHIYRYHTKWYCVRDPIYRHLEMDRRGEIPDRDSDPAPFVTLHGKTGKKVMTRARYFNTLDKRKFL